MAKITLEWLLYPDQASDGVMVMDSFRQTFDTDKLRQRLFHIEGVPYLAGRTPYDDHELMRFDCNGLSYAELLDLIQETEAHDG